MQVNFQVLNFLFLFSFSIHAKQEIGRVTFSWNKAGDVKFVAQYKGEELHPIVSWRVGGAACTTKESKKQFTKLVRTGRLLASQCLRVNYKGCSFWESIKSFFWEPENAGRQAYIIFDDASEKYEGPEWESKNLFTSGSLLFFTEWEKLRKILSS